MKTFFSNKISPLEAALDFADKKIPVFPCGYNKNDDNSKGNFSPLCNRGFKAATTDQIKIREWWTTFPARLCMA